MDDLQPNQETKEHMNSKILPIIALSSTLLFACKKDEDVAPTPPAPVPTTSMVKLSYDFVNGSAAFNGTVPIIDDQNRSIRLTKLKFYTHDFHIVDDDGVTVAEFQDAVRLVDAFGASNLFELGQMPAGQAHELELSLGLDSASSYGFPDQATAPFPLDDADMTWPWSAVTTFGRMFIKLEGYVDANNNTTMDSGEGFAYHAIGSGMQALPASYEVHTDVAGGTTFTIDLQVNVVTLVNGLALTGDFHNDGPQNQLLMQNLRAATSHM